MKKKSLISLLMMAIMLFVLMSSAFADVNMGSGDGTDWGDGTGDNVWAVRTESGAKVSSAEGLRITVYDAESNSKVYNTIDITGNASISAVPDIRYFADSTSGGTELIPKTSWLSSSYIGATYSGWDLCGVDNSYYSSRSAYENDRHTKLRYEGAVILIPTLYAKTYSVSLNAEMSIKPSQRCYTATYSNSTGLYTMKSGYGIEITMNSHISGDTEYCTGAQIGNVLFPEFNYNRENSAKYNRLLEKVGNNLVFKTNEYSTYGDRVHFTPIWYPDNKYYTVYAEVFDVWCPAGQLSMRLTDKIKIKGNVYDDWHIAPTNP